MNVQMNVAGQEAAYLCSDAATMAAVKANIGRIISFYTFASKDGSATFMSLPKSDKATTAAAALPAATTAAAAPAAQTSYQNIGGDRNASFACAYAKDIVVAMINKDLVTDIGNQIIPALEVFTVYFLGKLNGK